MESQWLGDRVQCMYGSVVSISKKVGISEIVCIEYADLTTPHLATSSHIDSDNSQAERQSRRNKNDYSQQVNREGGRREGLLISYMHQEKKKQKWWK